MTLNSNTYQKIVLEEEKGCEPAMPIWEYYPLANFIILVTVDKSFFFLFHIFYCRKESSTQPIRGSDTFK